MPSRAVEQHSNLDELVKVKIPALGRKGAKNNKAILKSIALNGPLLKYDVCKKLSEEKERRKEKKLPLSYYGTISKRIDALKRGGYLAEAKKRATKRGKQTEQTMYGLTWRGFIASLSIKEVGENIFQVLDNNPLLTIPEKDFVLFVLRNSLTQKESESLAMSLFHDFLETVEPNLEEIEEGQLKMVLFYTVLKEAQILEDAIKKKGLMQLLDNPKILQIVKEKIPPMKANLEKQLQSLYNSIIILDGISKVINSIKPGEKPSEKLKEFFNSKQRRKGE